MSTLEALRRFPSDVLNATLGTILNDAERRQREREDAAAADKREKLLAFSRSPKTLKDALAKKAEAEAAVLRANAAVAEAKQAFAERETAVAQIQWAYSEELRTLRRGAVAPYRLIAAREAIEAALDEMRKGPVFDVSPVMKPLIDALHLLNALLSGDADPPAEDFDTWLGSLLATTRERYEEARRAHAQHTQRAEKQARVNRLLTA
jgi:hypothetical protein